MKEDAPLPDRVPRKRREIEQALSLHIAMWLDGDTLTPSERRRLEDEKARRKALQPDNRIGVLVGEEGMTPEQFETFKDLLGRAQPTEIHPPGVHSRVHGYCKSVAPVTPHFETLGATAVIKAADRIIATPRSIEPS